MALSARQLLSSMCYRMEGVQRVYESGIRYTKKRYLPDTMSSLVYILIYTAVVFYVTEYLMRGKVTRWLYLGSMAMVGAMVYSGSISLDSL